MTKRRDTPPPRVVAAYRPVVAFGADHVIGETSGHAARADILRELIDGAGGR